MRSVGTVTARGWAIFLLSCSTAFAACGADVVGEEREGGEFLGEDPSTGDPNGDPPRNDESECSMFDTSSCAEEEACTPTAQGTLHCVEDAVLPIGDPCDPGGSDRCVGGALCFGAHHNGSFCVEVCDVSAADCPEGQECVPWVTVAGEALGRCN